MSTWTPAGPAWLFCPADRPDRYAKAAAAADVVILDLEDAVAPADKDAARRALAATPLDPGRTVVRVNAGDPTDDLRALRDTPYRRVMLPKAESAAQVSALRPFEVVALVESPHGALAVADLAAAENTIGLMWGPEDLTAALGGSSARYADGRFRHVHQQVRSTTLLAAKAHGRLALDTVHLDIADLDGQRAEAEDAVAIGFDGTVAIHPSQVPVIRAAYTPPPGEVEWARRVLEAARGERGVFRFEGRMVDSPVLRHAETLLRRA
ncbi:HpcH/HpaI aldolase/citrate lyase family protein [Cryptosporangium arvum]|uniref:Citrate lyase beta subunit n=1 Tax=Cryptosporangium arvum DSM 44712 TaxID=927661 RepID=A0A011AIE5_9ACTN|nr:CoA ester lyase [Cryptosporangium arvum]EXG81746.1 citrate lyase beta subunit [Cryptosporangium arvum DSM 44712]